jgi:predicted MFS family arabinose efflux permease
VLLVRLADESAYFLPSGTLEAFRADLDLTYAQAGAVLAVVAPGALVGGVFAAAADRFSRRAIAAGGTFGFAAALAAFALGGSFPVLVAAAFVMGCASTAMVDAAEVALVDVVGDDLRRYLARANLFATFGDLIGPGIVAGVAVAGLSWRWAFAIGAGLLAIYGAALAAVPLPPPDRSRTTEHPGPRSKVTAVLMDPAVWLLGLIGLLMGPFDEPLVGFTIALLEQERGASAGAATLVAVVGLSGGLLTFTVLARRLERCPDDLLLGVGVVLMTGGAVTIAVLPLVPAVAVAAFAASIGLNLAWLAVQHRQLTVRPGQVGTTKAVLSTIEFCGFWIPVAVGAVADSAGLVAAVGSYGLLGAALMGLARSLARRSEG